MARSRALKALGKNHITWVGLAIAALLVLAAALAPWLAPYEPHRQFPGEEARGLSAAHPLGQDLLGRDVLSRLLYGSRVSLWVALSTVSVSLLVGVAVGSLAGYWGGLADEAAMRVVDVLMAFPGLLLAIALMAVLGPGLNKVILALCLVGWVGYARLVRSLFLTHRELDYVAGARALGSGPLRIICRHILPNVAAPLIVQATFGMAGAIIAEGSLSFLGLGVQPPEASWGSMLNEGRQAIFNPHLTLFPGAAIMLVVLGFNFLGDGLRDALDVRANNS